jgi:hypothetical protein
MHVKEGTLALMLCEAQSEMNAVGLRKLSVCACAVVRVRVSKQPKINEHNMSTIV